MVKPTAAMPVRMNTSWNAGNCSTPIRMNRNDDPQISASNQNPPQACFVVIITLSQATAPVHYEMLSPLIVAELRTIYNKKMLAIQRYKLRLGGTKCHTPSIRTHVWMRPTGN